MSLIRASATIGSFTFISRIFGFVRDILIATFLGAGLLSDAFFVAFKIPNFMRQLFAEGAFNAAFVPLYARTRASEGPDAARTLAEEVQAGLVIALLVVTVLGLIFMPHLMMFLAPGFDKDPEKFHLTVLLSRITFPYIFFISLVSLQGGILNSIDRFAAVAATPIIMNICLISAMLLVTPFTPTAAHALAIGVMISGAAQYFWLYYYCRKAGVNPRFIRPRMTPNVRRLLTLIGPVTLGSSVTQVNLIINMMIASWVPAAVSILYYAVRISELPFGVIGVAVSTALLPMLSRQLREGNVKGALYSQNRALELSLLFGLPATAALIVIPYPIIVVLYEHGRFTAGDTVATMNTLIAFAVGLPAALAVKIFASTFYANQDTKTPVKIAIACVLVNLALNLMLVGTYKYVGLAFSTSVASWVNAILLGRQLHKRALFTTDDMLRHRLACMCIATFIMSLALWATSVPLAVCFDVDMLMKIIALCVLIAVGGLTYAACLVVLGVLKPSQIREYFRRAPAASVAEDGAGQ